MEVSPAFIGNSLVVAMMHCAQMKSETAIATNTNMNEIHMTFFCFNSGEMP